MVKAIEAAHLDEHVRQPGVAIVEWRHPKDAWSAVLGPILERASDAHPDVRFAAVDVSRDAAAARDWNVQQIPTIMGYRDGILVFSRAGALPEPAVHALIAAIWSLDMDEVRLGMDGHGRRTMIAFRGDQQPQFETISVERSI